jgi:hypothetical protein
MRGFPVLAFALVATTAFAQDSVYVGIGAGSFDYQENFVSPIIGQVADEVSVTKLLGGFQFNDHFALEMNIARTHQIRQFGTENVPPFGDVSDSLSMDLTITSLRALGQLPFDWGVLLAGLGYFSSENDFSETLSADCCETVVDSGSFGDDGFTTVLGLEWRFGRFGTRYGIRLEYEWWDLSGTDTSAVGIGVSYGF